MTLRRSWLAGAMLNGLALAGAAGTFVFGVLAGEGGRGHVRNIVLGVLCAMVPLAVGVASAIRASRRLRAEVEARDAAISARELALQSKEKAELEIARIRGEAAEQLITTLRARLSPILDLLTSMAAQRPNAAVDGQLGSLTQAIVGAAVDLRDSASSRRSIFFRATGNKLECDRYAGFEGNIETMRTEFVRGSDDSLSSYMFLVLDKSRAVLVPDVNAPDVSGLFPDDRCYQAAIAVAVTAGDTRYGILTLDAAEAKTLDETDLKVIKTLASLLAIGLALAAGGPRRRPGTAKDGMSSLTAVRVIGGSLAPAH